MNRNRKIFIGKCAAIFSIIPMLMLAYQSGPDARKTGGPGDSTCNESGCHVGTGLNAGGGSIQLTFSGGTTYTPGVTQTVTIKITDPVARVYGFQVSSRLASNTRSAQAGTFVPGTNEQVICEDNSNRTSRGCGTTLPLEFIEHSSPFSSGTIQFQWTPPSSNVGNVVFYAAGNAANGNGQNTGDHIYSLGTLGVTLTPAASGGPKPTISQGGVGDAFTGQAGIVSSMWTSIYGSNFSDIVKTWDGDPAFAAGHLPTSVNGVSVTVGGKPAAVYFVSPGQINILAPLDAAMGTLPIVVTNSAGSSDPMTVTKTTALPAFYAPFGANGKLFVTAVATNGDLIGNSVDPRVRRAVRPGEIISLFATGFGDTTPSIPTDQVSFTPAKVSGTTVIRVGDQVATILGGAGFLVSPGLYQFNITVPASLPDGDATISAQINSVTSASNVLLTVHR